MKREPKTVTSTCHCCHRPDWTRQVGYNLTSREESSFPIEVKGLPSGFEPMWASGMIYGAVEEAIEYCIAANVHGVGFEFNGHVVLVTAQSDKDKVIREWWQAVYHETPEESAARR